MKNDLRHTTFVAVVLASLSGTVGRAESLASAMKPFLTSHCSDCHANGAAEGGFDVATLTDDPTDAETTRRWTRVHDRLARGEMPPKDAEQPSAAARARALRTLASALTAADATQREVVLRRLNRVEYENTVRDLFGIHVDVRDLLPEDASAHGFDNNGEALALSTELMQAYLTAADAVLDATFGPEREPQHVHVKFPLEQDVQRHIGNLFRKVDDGVALFHSGYSPSAFRTFRPRSPGTYRVRIEARGFQSDEPVVMQVEGGDVITHRRPFRVIDYWALPPDRMTTVEFEARIGRYDSFHPKPYGTPGATKEKHRYPGPGIVIGNVEVEGPLEEWPPKSRSELLGDVDPATATLDDARTILKRLLPRAHRRTVADVDVEPFVGLVSGALDEGRPFVDALRLGLKGILCSPRFLFLEEPLDGDRIDDFALASRLSYFLWSSMPDERLFEAARRGRLRQPDVLRAEVERMLGDPRAEAFTVNFTGQWLDLRDIDFTTPDKLLHPEFDQYLQRSMLEESRRFFDRIVDENLPVQSFLDSDWTILNERLAKHYGIDGVQGTEFRVVKLPEDSVRGGVLTQAAVLKVTANGTNTSPVVRGVWVLENVLGRPTPPPPANVPAIEPDIRGATTIRDQLAKHREIGSCAACHRHIDPPGFALESFDVTGGYRDWYRSLGEGERINKLIHPRGVIRVRYRRGPDVDATGELPDGRAFADVRAFKQLLLADPDQITKCLAEKLLTYGTGRGLGFADRPAVATIVAAAKRDRYGFRDLIHHVVRSEPFRRP